MKDDQKSFILTIIIRKLIPFTINTNVSTSKVARSLVVHSNTVNRVKGKQSNEGFSMVNKQTDSGVIQLNHV